MIGEVHGSTLKVLGSVVTDSFSGGTPSSQNGDFWGGAIPWVTSAYLGERLHIEGSNRTLTAEGLRHSSARIAPPDSVLVGTRVGVGKTAVASVAIAISQDLTALVLDRDRAEPDYVAYALRSAEARRYFASTKRGATIQGIPREVLLQMELPLPPLPEQRAIANVLSVIQTARDATTAVRLAATQLKHAIAEEVFGRIRASGAPELHVGDVADVSSGGTPSRSKAEYWRGSIPWVKTAEIDGRPIFGTEELITPEGLAAIRGRTYPPGTVLVAMYGNGITRGRAALLEIQAAVNQACAAVRSPSRSDATYLYYWLGHSYDRLRSLGHGANQKNLNAEIVRQFPIPWPDSETRARVASLLPTVDRKVEAETQTRKAIDVLFAGALRDLLRGTKVA